ncbi:MAG TPA: hypothetical protein VMB71_12270 [Acetobacteraceae bacterium]|nr:hypothetical protein [Acetobacteraceae bacterium]
MFTKPVARELAVLAGHDADAGVAGPGGKMMPAWCTFRDAARGEHMAAEATALELPPQAPTFQNVPLQVFGQHDKATIAQMRNCMGVGNVVAGVVCADGHLGYAQSSAASSRTRSRSASPVSASTSAAATWPCAWIRLTPTSKIVLAQSWMMCAA